jgi:acid phosphatase (class A)
MPTVLRRSLIPTGLAGLVSAGLLAACANLAVEPPAPALWTDYSDHPAAFLAKDEGPDAADFLKPPPSLDSPRGLADLEAYRTTRALKDSPRWTLAARDAELYRPDSALGAFACALGAEIKPAKAPRLAVLLGRIPADVDLVQERAKKTFARPRPFVTNPAPICVKMDPWLPGSGSYPSGHAATGWAWGLILAQIAPDRAAPILTRAAAIGQSRVVCGVHYESDVEAGRMTAAALVSRLQAQANFQSDLDAARIELAAARKTAPAPDCALETAAFAQGQP